MRAGKLDRTIVLQRAAEAVSAQGSVSEAWVTLGDLRAEVVNLSATATGATFGEVETTGVMFRTRYIPDLRTADRLIFDGNFYSIKSVAEIGRRRGLEIRVERTE